jgi:hypothetical protein
MSQPRRVGDLAASGLVTRQADTFGVIAEQRMIMLIRA